MAGLQEYKCPCCGGAIEFNSDVQKMKCPYCDSEFELEALLKFDNELAAEKSDSVEWDLGETVEWNDSEKAGMRLFVCQSCGGEIIGDENMAAAQCPYCGNNVVIMGQFAGGLKPDAIIPFKINKQAAIDGMSKHLMGKKLLPKVFKDENHIEEVIGVYVPFWLFDSDVSYFGHYKATKVRHWSDSRYRYTETTTYSVSRDGFQQFRNVPADGSKKMADDLMNSIEPFNYNEVVPFQTAYLAGYVADKYDVTKEEVKDIVTERMKFTADMMLRRTVIGYNSVVTLNKSIQCNHNKAKYALLPVWILNTKWNDKNFTFAMNGQTGKFVGNLPLDKKLYWKFFGMWTGIVSVGTFLLSLLIYYFS
ncbi:MAG: hypothetical protein MJ113_02165 [Lachnospiraceae bacterium]|nr:hypothetical protein [Lachnospiraceae bacterium]